MSKSELLMRRLRLLVVLAVFLYPANPTYAHGDHDDVEHLIEIYQRLVEVFSTHAHQINAANSEGVETVYVDFQGEMIPVNASAMHQLLTIATLDFGVRELQTKPPLLKRLLRITGQFLASIPTKVYNTLRYPRLTVKNLLTAVEAYTHRLSHSYSPGMFVVIAVTEGAWEAVESIIMPGGIHVACVYVNGLILSATVPLERIANFTAFKGSGYTRRQRILLALKATLSNIKAMLGPRRKQWLLDDAKQQTRLRLSNKTLVVNNPTDLEQLLMDWGFFDAIAKTHLAKATPQTGQVDLLMDINNVLDQSRTKAERFYIAWAHLRGHQMKLGLLETLATAARTEKWLPRNEYLLLERVVGRLRRTLNLYSSSLMMLAVGDLGTAQLSEGETLLDEPPTQTQLPIKPVLQQTLKDMLAVHETLASQLKTLHDMAAHLKVSREHLASDQRQHDGETSTNLETQLQESEAALLAQQVKFNTIILKLNNETKATQAKLKQMRAGTGYLPWFMRGARRSLSWARRNTYRAASAVGLGPLIDAACSAAFGGRPRME